MRFHSFLASLVFVSAVSAAVVPRDIKKAAPVKKSFKSEVYRRNQYNPRRVQMTKTLKAKRHTPSKVTCSEFQKSDTCYCDPSTQEVTFGDRCQFRCKDGERRVNYVDSQGRDNSKCVGQCSEFQKTDTCYCDPSTQEVTFGDRCQFRCKDGERRINYVDSQGRDNSKCVAQCSEFQTTDNCYCDPSTQEVTFGNRCQARCQNGERRVNYVDSQGRDNSKCVAQCSEFQTTDNCYCDPSTQEVTFGNRCQAQCKAGESRVNYVDAQGRDNSKCLGPCSEFQTTDTCQCDPSTQTVTFGNRCQAQCKAGETRVNYKDSQGRDNSRCDSSMSNTTPNQSTPSTQEGDDEGTEIPIETSPSDSFDLSDLLNNPAFEIIKNGSPQLVPKRK